MKIMAVEATTTTVAYTLQHSTLAQRYEVDALSEKAARAKLEEAAAPQYDLVIIDSSVLEQDGLNLCHYLRASGWQAPLLLLIEADHSHPEQLALNADADDYLLKPFGAEALAARIEFLIRRNEKLTYQQQASTGWGEMSSALSLAAEGIARLNPQGQYLFVNDAYARMAGYTPDEMIGCAWQKTVHPDDQPLMMVAYQQMLHDGKVEVEARGLRKDGSTFDKRLAMVAAYRAQQRFSGHYCFMKDISEQKQTEIRLQQQLNRVQLTTQIMDAIRQTLELDQILQTAVEQVRRYLKTDRVIVFRFGSDWQGRVAAESVNAGLTETLGMKIQDLCFGKLYADSYCQGRVSAIPDINAANIDACHVELLSAFEVRANLVVPILQGEKLWGLLIAHHCCGPRQWIPENTLLLQQVATQLGIAIHQAELYQQNRQELLERRQIQDALAHSEERFRSLSTFAPVGIYQTDIEGHYIYTNARWQEIAGLTFVESLGDQWARAIHPDDREQFFAAWTQLVDSNHNFDQEFRFLTPEGEEHWVHGQAIPMRSKEEEVIGYVGVNEDITARKLAEQKIRQQAALIDIASDAIYVRELNEGRIVFWSKGAEKLYGWCADETIGKIAYQLFNKSRARIEEIVETTLKRGSWQGELTQTTKAGTKILVSSRWTLINDDRGEPQSLLTVNTDITDKKQLEAQFYQAQRLESLGQLAGGIAHDLGNILTPILGIAQLFKLTLKDTDRATQEQLEILEHSAKRGAKMVRQILTFAQGGGGDKTAVDVNVVLQEVIDVARQGFPNSIEIRQTPSNPTRPSPKVSADSTQLHQVFMNLCVNARDAMPEGGVLTISVETRFINEDMASKRLEASEGDYVVVAIADTGEGIPPEIQERIFDPFFTTKTPDKGTGLGLATVAGIIKKTGGFLTISSEVDSGTQVKVYLPLTSF